VACPGGRVVLAGKVSKLSGALCCAVPCWTTAALPAPAASFAARGAQQLPSSCRNKNQIRVFQTSDAACCWGLRVRRRIGLPPCGSPPAPLFAFAAACSQASMAFAAAKGMVPQLIDLPRPPTSSGMVGVAAMLQHATARAVAATEAAAAAAVQRVAEALEATTEPADGVRLLPGPSLVKLLAEGLTSGGLTGGFPEVLALADKLVQRYGPVVETQLGAGKALIVIDPTLADQLQGAKGHAGMKKSSDFLDSVSWAAGRWAAEVGCLGLVGMMRCETAPSMLDRHVARHPPAMRRHLSAASLQLAITHPCNPACLLRSTSPRGVKATR